MAALSSTWTLGAIVFAATWGGGAVAPSPFVVDVSAHAGLNMAAERGLAHGSDLVFSYGPLGFLKTYVLFYTWPARLAAAYGIALHLALSLSLVWATRRSFSLPIAFALSLVAAALLRGDVTGTAVRVDAAVVVLVFMWCVAALSESPPPWARRLVVFAAGPVAAIELLAKLNTGLVVLALLAVTVVAIEPERRRNLAVFSASFAASLALLWFATGQALGDVGDWVSGSVGIISGYSSAARLESGGREYDAVVVPASLAITFGIAWVSTRALAPRRRAVIVAMLALVAFAAFKAGFVLHYIFHVTTFYATLLGAALAFRLPARPEARYFGLVAIVGVAGACATTAFTGYPKTDPVENVRNGFSTVEALASAGKSEQRIAAGRAALTAAYDLDPRTLALLEGRAVHVDPFETGAAWAYGLDWRPLPVFQTYAAWTEELDRRNAAALASDAGPERVLRGRDPAAGRYASFQSPAAIVEMLCHFRALRTTERWQVLDRVRDRCGEPVALKSVEASYGEPIRVPAARGKAVFARVHGVEVSGLERVQTFLYRSRSREVRLDAGPPHIVAPGTVGDGVLLRSPRRVDFPRPFAIAPNAREVTFLLGGKPSSERLEVDFFAMPVSPPRTRHGYGS